MSTRIRRSRKQSGARGHFSLGCLAEQQGQFGHAREHLAAALALDSKLADAVHSLFARMLWTEQKWPEAIAAADVALASNPRNFLALIVRSRCCSALSRMPEASESNRRALEIAPHAEFHSQLLFEMNLLEDTTPETLFAEARRWDSLYAAPLAPRMIAHANDPDPDRRLKVGYVSSDLHQHAIMKFLPPVLERHDRSQFEVFVYATGAKSDHCTEQIRTSADNFYSIQDPESLAERVRSDRIDVLVDLAGHTMGRAYLAFALKPAPVQVSWQGVLVSTGLSAMDYFLGDAQMPLPGSEHLISETVYRLPRVFCCYRPSADVPVAPAPCLNDGLITFGCFNNPQKITREAVRLWSAILHLAPGSRLLLKYSNLENPAVHEHLGRWFAEDGIAADRVIFEGASPPAEYLSAYARIDVALDPFPYNGLTITLDALWMGVPVVTLAGRLPVQRAGASALTAAGFPGLVASSPEDYWKLALHVAQVARQSPALRGTIRAALRASPLMDEVGLVRSLEDAFREMWRAWVEKKPVEKKTVEKKTVEKKTVDKIAESRSLPPQ
jgi:protein O-GlcNAc transferase